MGELVKTPQLAIFADYIEEGWPSMDLVAEMLNRQLSSSEALGLNGRLLVPRYQNPFSRIPVFANHGTTRNLLRFYNRFVAYPRYVRSQVGIHSVFHVADHSYAGLVHSLPPEKTGVYCHDLDAFRCLLEPAREPRPWWFRRMARHVLTGMQKAKLVFHNSLAVRDAILYHGLVEPSRLIHAPLGVAEEFTCTSSPAGRLQDAQANSPRELSRTIVHVGSCISRKRIDVLLNLFAEVLKEDSDVKLIKVGGEFTSENLAQIRNLGLGESLVHLQGLSRSELAEVYRSASVVVVPSEAEGFGLPVIEALACGAPVIASDIPVLREVGGEVVGYAPVGAIDKWVPLTTRVLENPNAIAVRDRRLAHVSQYTWAKHAQIIAQAYLQLA